MKCPNHLTRSVAGYCCTCGSFFCEDCLTRHEGNLYCRKHYKPIADQIQADERLAEGRKRHARHSLRVNFRDGRKGQGVCRTMNIRESGFHLECADDNGISTGKTDRVRFEDVRSVCHVKSYDGNFDRHEKFQEYSPGGDRVVVEYPDGEILMGTTMHAYNPDHPRFYLIPLDPNSNNINVLVEASATKRVYTEQEYVARQEVLAEQAAEEKLIQKEQGVAKVGQEESMGDFYFEQHNYPSAHEQYELAAKEFPDSGRIRKKLVVTRINVGIGSIKTRDYPKALEWMDKARELDPDNPHAKKKSKQLRKIIEKTQKRMREYMEGNLASGQKEDTL